MRAVLSKSLVLFIAVGASTAIAQQPPEKKDDGKKSEAKAKPPSPLDELLAKALKHNPDIKVAESKVREAEAELNRVRLQVMQKVVKLQHEIEVQKSMVDAAEAQVARIRRLFESKVVSSEEIHLAESALKQAKAKLAQAEAELPYLLGKQSSALLLTEFAVEALNIATFERFTLDAAGKDLTAAIKIAQAPSGAEADKVRQALDVPIKGDFNGVILRDVLDHIREHTKGVNLHFVSKKLDLNEPITLTLRDPVPLGAVLQWFEDNLGLRCVARDYGIVITDQDRVPPGAVFVHDFWKRERSTESKSK